MYIPDLTERFPEGFDGPDMYEPYNPEYAMWEAMEKDYNDTCEEDKYDLAKEVAFAETMCDFGII